MNLRNSASGELPSCASEPLMIGTPPDLIQPFISSSSISAVEKNFLAVSLASGVAFEEIDRYWPGLPTVLLGSPLPPSMAGKLVKPRPPLLTKLPPLACWIPYDQEPCSIIAALPV